MTALLKTALLGALAILPAAAGAHPHVYVDARAGFAFTPEGALGGLRVSWTYDAFTTLFLIETLDLDRDGDGSLDAADRAAVVAGETDWPPGYEGDVYLEVGGAGRALGRPGNAEASLEGDRLTVAFDLPLAAAAPVAGEAVVLRLYDPTYYHAYAIMGADAAGPLPPSCDATVIPFEPSEAEAALQTELAALSRDEMPAREGVGRLFSDEVVLACG